MRRDKPQADSDPSAQEASFEIMDDAPLTLRRPLSRIGNYAYAAIWPYTRMRLAQTVSELGDPIEHNPPITHHERRLCIVRNDGKIFGDGTNAFDGLGVAVALKEMPPDEKLWSGKGVKAFAAFERHEPAKVFEQVVDVVDRFIDFDRSLADQGTMSELVACYILATWFLDAFNVIGFVWPNGESGSGKTQLLTLIAEMGYLGQVILAGGSYASLRDLADYGATLCFDDAENLADAKRTDPDKRALLLAGNRRGNTVSVKEPVGNREWRTRYVNTFCPRTFSAIRVPDKVLASRTIVIPLIRTPDKYRADADPLDYALWPHDRRTLIDSLWSIALENLCDLATFESRINKSSRLSGRNLEPWRAILAVAAWLDENGAEGLYKRLDNLSVSYQQQRRGVETDDLTILVIRALSVCLDCDVVTLCDGCDVCPESSDQKTFILTADIAKAAIKIADDEELDITPDSRRIGLIMRRQRFDHGDQAGTHKKGWKVSKRAVARLVQTYGLVTTSDTHGSNVTKVTEGHNVTFGGVDTEVELAEGNKLAWYAQTSF